MGLETRRKEGTGIGTDLENIAIVKIIKDNETSNFLIESRVSHRRGIRDRYRSREHRVKLRSLKAMKSPNFYFGLETHTDGGTKNGTDPENIAIGKIMKGSEISSVFAVLTLNVNITRFCSFCRNRDRSPRRERDRDRDRRDRERRHRDRDKSDRDRREVRTPTKTTHFYWLLLMFFNAHQKRRSAQVLKWQNCRQN